MRTYNNVYLFGGIRYSACYITDESVESSDRYARLPNNAEHWVGREERWNHNVLCPPVGMRADQASHVYVVGGHDDWTVAVLVPR